MFSYANKSQCNNISVAVPRTTRENRDTHTQITPQPKPCTCRPARLLQLSWEHLCKQRWGHWETWKNTHSHLLFTPVQTHQWRWVKKKEKRHRCSHTHKHNTCTDKETQRKATWFLTHSFQSGNLERTAHHCRELELKTRAEKKKGIDCFWCWWTPQHWSQLCPLANSPLGC